MITLAADVALVVDCDGVIEDLSLSNDELLKEGVQDWIGRHWIETVTVESRPKVEQLLSEAARDAPARWREINHSGSNGTSLPVRYSVLPIGANGRRIAIGRDLRALSALQQQLMQAQHSMEREYARLRHAETRYRLLFQISSEPVLIVEAISQKLVDANPAATELLALSQAEALGRDAIELFDPGSRAEVRDLLAEVRFAGRASDAIGAVLGTGRNFVISATLFRQENAAHLLMRLTPISNHGPAVRKPLEKTSLVRVVEALPDSFVVTGPDRRILTMNMAFLELIQLASPQQALGQPIERWLGRAEVDINVLMANLREYSSIRSFGTMVRGEYGSVDEVEVSAVAALDGEEPCYGFVIRPGAKRLVTEARSGRQLPQSVEQLTELVGRVPLREIVRDTTDIIERLCVEAALELTSDNRASAAQMLGLSRQSLYAKLRRYGLGDDAEEDA